jgi:DNA invertase Pin-like site-specific DNA recombinase
MSRLVMGILALIAVFENDIRRERQMDGIKKARGRGVKFGRKPLLVSARGGGFRREDDNVTGTQFRKIREALGLDPIEIARALDYRGTDTSVSRHIRNLETGTRPIPAQVARLMEMFKRHGVPRRWTS